MRRSLLPVLVISIFFTACGGEKKPSGILPKRDMVRILSEIYLAEEKMGGAGIPYDSIIKLFPQLEVKVLEKAGIPDSVFRKSMEYYKSNPKELEYIYTALVDSLNLKAQSTPLGSKPDDVSQ